MGLTTIDPRILLAHSHKEQTNDLFTKSPSLVKTDPVVSKIQPFEKVKIYKEMYGHPDALANGWRA